MLHATYLHETYFYVDTQRIFANMLHLSTCNLLLCWYKTYICHTATYSCQHDTYVCRHSTYLCWCDAIQIHVNMLLIFVDKQLTNMLTRNLQCIYVEMQHIHVNIIIMYFGMKLTFVTWNLIRDTLCNIFTFKIISTRFTNLTH